jgi:hypothetical protein
VQIYAVRRPRNRRSVQIKGSVVGEGHPPGWAQVTGSTPHHRRAGGNCKDYDSGCLGWGLAGGGGERRGLEEQIHGKHRGDRGQAQGG